MANPQHFRRSERTLRRQQRTLSRRKKGSRRRREAARLVARTHLTVARQRRDFHHKTVKAYAERYARIYVEDPHVAGMVRNRHLAKSISDASWGASLEVLQDKAASASHAVVRVPAHSTSQRCSRCGEVVPKTLSVRTHVCTHCGYVDDRDTNAAAISWRAGSSWTRLGHSRRRTTRALALVRREAGAVWRRSRHVLHAFQKKAKRGIATPRRDLVLIRARRRRAEELDAVRIGREGARR